MCTGCLLYINQFINAKNRCKYGFELNGSFENTLKAALNLT